MRSPPPQSSPLTGRIEEIKSSGGGIYQPWVKSKNLLFYRSKKLKVGQ